MQFFKQNLRFACFADRRREKKEIIIMHTYLPSVLRSARITTMNYRNKQQLPENSAWSYTHKLITNLSLILILKIKIYV